MATADAPALVPPVPPDVPAAPRAQPLTAADVALAAVTVQEVAHRTPLLSSRTLDDAVGAAVLLKAEHLQRTGSFKLRGAWTALRRLPPHRRPAGVVAYSSGNHAQAVAFAARALGMPCWIVMPHDAPVAKRAATAGYGATVVGYDRRREDRAAIAARLAEDTGACLVAPFDDPDVVAGQGSATVELLAGDGPAGGGAPRAGGGAPRAGGGAAGAAVDVVVVPVGGGGLCAGAALACAGRVGPAGAPVRVVGVEPAAGDDTARSLAAGRRVMLPQPETIADSLASPAPGELTLPVLQAHRVAVVTVTDAELLGAVRFAVDRLHQVLEPGGAAGLAAVLNHRVALAAGERVGVVLSGGNVGTDRLAALLGGQR